MKKYDSVEGIVELLSRVQGLPFVLSDKCKFEALIPDSIYGRRYAACTLGVDAAVYTAIWISEPTADSICTIGDMIYDRGTHRILYERLMGYVGLDEKYYCFD